MSRCSIRKCANVRKTCSWSQAAFSPRLLFSRRKNELLEALEHIEYLGSREIDGLSVHGFQVDCERANLITGIRCSESLSDVDEIRFYLLDGEQPLLAAMEARVASLPEPVLMVMEWDLEPGLPDSQFRFDPPAGYRRVDSLVGELRNIFEEEFAP